MSNQTQAPTTSAAAPQTIHIWMFAFAVFSTILAIPHAIVAFMLEMPSAIVNLHIAITLGFWIGGVIFATHRPQEFAVSSPKEPETDAQPLTPAQRSQLAEVDAIEAWLHRTDEGDR